MTILMLLSFINRFIFYKIGKKKEYIIYILE